MTERLLTSQQLKDAVQEEIDKTTDSDRLTYATKVIRAEPPSFDYRFDDADKRDTIGSIFRTRNEVNTAESAIAAYRGLDSEYKKLALESLVGLALSFAEKMVTQHIKDTTDFRIFGTDSYAYPPLGVHTSYSASFPERSETFGERYLEYIQDNQPFLLELIGEGETDQGDTVFKWFDVTSNVDLVLKKAYTYEFTDNVNAYVEVDGAQLLAGGTDVRYQYWVDCMLLASAVARDGLVRAPSAIVQKLNAKIGASSKSVSGLYDLVFKLLTYDNTEAVAPYGRNHPEYLKNQLGRNTSYRIYHRLQKTLSGLLFSQNPDPDRVFAFLRSMLEGIDFFNIPDSVPLSGHIRAFQTMNVSQICVAVVMADRMFGVPVPNAPRSFGRVYPNPSRRAGIRIDGYLQWLANRFPGPGRYRSNWKDVGFKYEGRNASFFYIANKDLGVIGLDRRIYDVINPETGEFGIREEALADPGVVATIGADDDPEFGHDNTDLGEDDQDLQVSAVTSEKNSTSWILFGVFGVAATALYLRYRKSKA